MTTHGRMILTKVVETKNEWVFGIKKNNTWS